jgi:hypothetical protein
VLRSFGTELSDPQIANELVVALSSVRTHTKSIYRKLGVNNRQAAVRPTIIVVGIISLLSVVTLRQDFAGAAGADAASFHSPSPC